MPLKIRNIDKYQKVMTLDCHTEGEPLRIITEGFPEPEGSTMLEKRQYVLEHNDHLRKLLMFEPRGHADMYGALLTNPANEDSDFGVLFMHNEGYSSMCGHGIIAIVTALYECGELPLGETKHKKLNIDSPAGLIKADAAIINGELRVTFDCVPSFVEASKQNIFVPGFGKVTYDIAFGGAYYVYVDADQHDIDTSKNKVSQLIQLGRDIKHLVSEQCPVTHPEHDDLSFIYGTIFYSKQGVKATSHSKHICIFANGEVDRSPTGTGVSGRVALLQENEETKLNQEVTIESIIGTKMSLKVKETLDYFGRKVVVPTVGGKAYITGQHEFLLDPNDSLQQGFLLR